MSSLNLFFLPLSKATLFIVSLSVLMESKKIKFNKSAFSLQCRRSINGDFTRVLEIDECPYASIETRPLDDLSEPAIKETELPF